MLAATRKLFCWSTPGRSIYFLFVVRWSCYHIISCNRPTCSSVILRVDNTDIEILLPIRIIQEEFFLYSDNNTNITSTINTHRAAQPLPDKWRPMLVCMMKGYAPMLRYHNQLHQQLGHEMKPFRLPPLHRSPSPVNRVHCSTPKGPHKPRSASVLPNILAVMRVQYSPSSSLQAL